MLDFQLFRIQVYLPDQPGFFDSTRNPRTILDQVICSAPSADLWAGTTGHIGNISQLDETAYYFRFGKTRKTNIQVFKDGSFEDVEFEQAPYTHVILDTEREVCAIARNTRVSARVYGIASQLSRLLNRCDVADEHRVTFGIGAVNDPADFISYLHEAIAVEKLWLTFSLPNAFDSNKDFEEPLKETLKELRGDKGKVEFEGTELKTDIIEDTLRSTAAVGNDAGATLILPGEKQRVRKSLRGNAVLIHHEDVALDEDRKTVLGFLRHLYDTVRGTQRNG